MPMDAAVPMLATIPRGRRYSPKVAADDHVLVLVPAATVSSLFRFIFGA